jgi:CRISP-associated protein Cas1
MPILPSHKTNIEYLEYCKVVAADDRLVYVRKKDALDQHFAIPYGNTALLLLGPGTSLTQQAARLAASQGMVVAFTAGGSTPIYLAAQNEYREPIHMQNWYPMWLDNSSRLEAAKRFQEIRVATIKKSWRDLEGVPDVNESVLSAFVARAKNATDTAQLLSAEADLAKRLYGQLASHFERPFKREQKSKDTTNSLLDNGNYLAYGLGAAALWIMGIPHSFPLMHGKTRRGALVFDVADLVKDAAIMPNAFLSASLDETDSQFRKRCLGTLDSLESLRLMCKAIEEVSHIRPAK